MIFGPMLRNLFAFIMISACAASCEVPIASARPVEIGMCVRMIYDTPAEIERQFDLMAKMNVKWVRADFDWSAIEGERGQFDWSYPDRIVQEAAKRDMKVLALLAYTPSWARPLNTTTHFRPSEPDDFAAFAGAAASRYASRGIHTWEIWNEPNSGDFWLPRPNADEYGQLFRAAAAAVREVDRDATLITGGLTRGTDTQDGLRVSQTTFLEELYRNGAARLASAIGVHPYTFPSMPMGNPSQVGGFADLPALHALMQRFGDGAKRIWITEFGAPTGSGAGAVSDSDQAASLLQARQLAESWDWTGPLTYYELRDSGTDANDIEQNFGVLRADLGTKDAGAALMG